MKYTKYIIGALVLIAAVIAGAQFTNREAATGGAFNDTFNVPYDLQHAADVVYATYGDNISFDAKDKNLLKFGTHTSIGTGWETLAEMQDSETAETLLSLSETLCIVSTSAADTGQVTIEYHATDTDDNLVFGTQNVTLTGTASTSLTSAGIRFNRMFNSGTSTDLLVGNIAVYECDDTLTSGKPDTDSSVHLFIEAGEQQTQKAQTAISGVDYWIVSSATFSVISNTNNQFAEARIEVKPYDTDYWLPITQNIAAKANTGTVQILELPYVIVPKNYDVRIAVKASAASVQMSGGFNGYLAKVFNN